MWKYAALRPTRVGLAALGLSAVIASNAFA